MLMSLLGYFNFYIKSASSVANNQGIIIDKNYGNFNQNNNMKIIEKDMYQYDIQEDDVDNIVDNEIELFNTNNYELELEKVKIEQARQKINNTNIEINVSNNIVRKKKFKIDVFVNNKKIFPIRRNEEDKFIFSIKLNKGDIVQLIKNKNDVIYNDTFHYSGTYEFLIYNNGNIKVEIINVNKTSYETIIYDGHKNIDTINKEVEEIMNNITEWDKI